MNNKSNKIRAISAESDSLHLGMGWDADELDLPHIIIESTYGESHPGSSHLLRLSNYVRDGVLTSGGRPSLFFTTDICDGVAQGSEGLYYSLASRDFIALMVEIHVRASLCDGIVLLSSCDKSVPAHILSAARLQYPAIIVPGGCMSAGPDFSTVDQLWELRRKIQSDSQEYSYTVMHCCPSEGACQPMGTASTMQIMAEALGLALPGSAVTPASNQAIVRNAKRAGTQILKLMQMGLTSKEILTKEAFENSIMVHAAIGGSTNAVLHLIAAAQELGIPIGYDDFERNNRKVPYLLDIMNTGKYPIEYFWYAGGVPALMYQIKDFLHLDAMTVSGKTVGENIDHYMNSPQLKVLYGYLRNIGLSAKDVIKGISDPVHPEGGTAILKGNIAPEGAIVKHSAVSEKMKYFVGSAVVFYDEDDALAAFSKNEIQSGDVIVILNQGPVANGMPEMFRTSDIITHYHIEDIAVITDGRYSGCTSGPAIGYISPESSVGGPIGLIRTGDLVELDISNRTVNLVEKTNDSKYIPADHIINERAATQRACMEPSGTSRASGARSIHRQFVTQASSGAVMRNKKKL